MTSFAPSCANVRAVARPIPDAPPVTNATFPSTRPAMIISPASTSCRVGHFPHLGYLWGAPAVLCAPILYAVSSSIGIQESVMHAYPVEVEAHPTCHDGAFLADQWYAYSVEQTGYDDGTYLTRWVKSPTGERLAG